MPISSTPGPLPRDIEHPGHEVEEAIARRAGLPTRGRVRGVITLVQEDRFRLEDENGRGYLFVLGRGAGASVEDLYRWSGRKAVVTVEFEAPPDMGAVATAVYE